MAEKLYATLHTNHGPIRLQLFPDHAPATVRNFVELAEGTKDYVDPRTGQKGSGPYYDGTISHRVIANFMVVLDLTVANVSVPHIACSLGVSLDQGTWIITSYSVSEAE